ncbi:MAG: kinase [Legionellales bacterium]|nr:kinase [Legionellales bacterium]|tara:strand:- start:504 stop:1757 length:1254 start_codon:yes stop_codon:yes gene_type:complete
MMKKTLDIYLEHSLVGHLLQDRSGRLRFRYTDEWLHYRNKIPLSWSLPLREEAYNEKACRSFFAGILPEETARRQIARIVGVSARNDYALLEQIGGECAGAISFLPSGVTPPEVNYRYQALDEGELHTALEILPQRPLLVGDKGLRLSLAGVQDKLAVYVDEDGGISLPLGGAPSTHILKPAIPRFPNVASNEALCLELAKAIGIPAATATVRYVGDIEYLLVERYDRKIIAGEPYPQRLHQEDFCQALGVPPEHKYQSEGGPNLKTCFALIREASKLPAVDIINLLNLVIFNIIVGNNDAHGKNFSLLISNENGKIMIQFAPAYDVLSTVYYPDLTDRMAMKFGKQADANKITQRNITHFADSAGLGVAAVGRQMAEVSSKVLQMLPEIGPKYRKIPDLVDLIAERAEKISLLAGD